VLYIALCVVFVVLFRILHVVLIVMCDIALSCVVYFALFYILHVVGVGVRFAVCHVYACRVVCCVVVCVAFYCVYCYMRYVSYPVLRGEFRCIVR